MYCCFLLIYTNFPLYDNFTTFGFNSGQYVIYKIGSIINMFYMI
jgi:hypothetical protein